MRQKQKRIKTWQMNNMKFFLKNYVQFLIPNDITVKFVLMNKILVDTRDTTSCLYVDKGHGKQTASKS